VSEDLVEFIRARLAEDELWALAASSPDSWRGDYPPVPTGVRWTWALGDNWEPYEIDPMEEHIGESAGDQSLTLVTVDEWPRREPGYGHTHFRHDVISYAEEVRTVDGAHIARHDPARVLRDVAAKRRILALADKTRAWTDGSAGATAGYAAAIVSDTLRLLALPYVDHPDFRPEWSPDA
jgi:hypothetical protein